GSLNAKWYTVLAAWRGPSAVAATTALVLASISLQPGTSALPAYTGVFLAATAFLLAWAFQSATITWVGSTLALGSIAYALAHSTPGMDLPVHWHPALLYHATISLAASVILKW